MKLAFIGGGVMGEAIISAVLSKGLAKAQDVVACDVLAQRRRHLESSYKVRAVESSADAVPGAEVVVLAVKPQEFASAGRQLNGRLDGGQTIMSIMAGVPIATICDTLRHKSVVRVIPNTPAQIGEGFSVWTATPEVSEAARGQVAKLLGALGLEVYVPEEKYIDMATAVSSSGPAYVFLVIEALIDAAVHIGIRRGQAVPMVLQTVLGSARYAQATGRHPAELKNQVTSPGGTTTEGLLVLEEAGVRAAFIHAIEAAYEKAKQLGG
ncbi:MAG: pyrroline-5-carboxylate reductase [Chloroflexi bacterium]|nr:pyrroline-5-carboxylate reductase [Chloroflexota bacterium]